MPWSRGGGGAAGRRVDGRFLRGGVARRVGGRAPGRVDRGLRGQFGQLLHGVFGLSLRRVLPRLAAAAAAAGRRGHGGRSRARPQRDEAARR